MKQRRRIFHSFLASHLQAYLKFRQKLGYTSFSNARPAAYTARNFDYYVLFHGMSSAKDLDERLVANWMHSIPRHTAATKNAKLCFARGFFNYLMRVGMAQDNPALRIPYLKQQAYKPYVYTLKEIHQILEEARRHQRRHPDQLVGWTMEILVFLIYACGLRISEALNLSIQDVDFEQNTLSLWKTKFHKERLVPFSSAVGKTLRSYLAIRGKVHPPAGPQAPFFCHAEGKYTRGSIEARFRQLLVRCGLAKPAGRGPRLHDLRHAMAVHRLYKWYQEGHDILNKLPLLSTYMGHVNVENTQVYLTIAQALLREGDRRFQRAFEDVTNKTLGRALKKL